jgi:hypothetical protein
MYLLFLDNKIYKPLGYGRLECHKHDGCHLIGVLARPFDTTNPCLVTLFLHIAL